MSDAPRADWHQRRRASFEALFDPGTVRLLEALGVSDGWRCLDLSARGGAVTRWCCTRVGAQGMVVATDPDQLEPEQLGSATVLDASTVFEHTEEASFDLVRARSTLAHRSDRDVLIKAMVGCVRPGGWLFVEETDWISAAPVTAYAAGSFERLYKAALRYWRSGGYDPQYGRRLAADLEAGGLAEVATEGRVFLMRGGSAELEWLRLSLETLRHPAFEPGSLSERQIDRALGLLDDPDFAVLSPTMMAAWGRRP